MTAISKSFVDAADTAVDPDSVIDTMLMTGFRDSLRHLREWMGASYYAGAVQDHNHDGSNSATVQIGVNYLRNGSFESGVAGWAQTNYTGGSQAISTVNAQDGLNCLAITSTVLANGGGYAQTSEYEPVVAGRSYFLRGNVMASAANISSKVEMVWFDSTKTQISLTALYSSSATSTVAGDFSASAIAPTNAKYKQLRITGGVPGVGSAVGTIYFDGLIATTAPIKDAIASASFYVPAVEGIAAYVANGSGTPSKAREWKVSRNGTYLVRSWLYMGTSGGATANCQVYKNGVAVGTVHSTNFLTAVSFDETFLLVEGDLIQIYGYTGSVSYNAMTSGQIGEVSPTFCVRTQ
jgi:hypothetical protein